MPGHLFVNALARLLTVLSLTMVTASGIATESPTNLLKNAGFEDSRNWLNHWKVENTRENGEPYYALLDENGGGWGEAHPHDGKRAIEIYSAERVTRLSQKVSLSPGRYRLTVWACNQTGMGAGGQKLILGLGEQVHTIVAPIMGYRPYYADFDIAGAGEYEASVYSPASSYALDDLSLVRVATSEREVLPCLFAELCPASPERAKGIRYLPGRPMAVGQYDRLWRQHQGGLPHSSSDDPSRSVGIRL